MVKEKSEDIDEDSIKEIIDDILGDVPNRDSEKEDKIWDFTLANLPSFLELINIKKNSKNSRQIKDLISRSESDIPLAEFAHKQGDYNNAVYHLQQSVEKLMKAIGLYFGIVDDVKKEIKHDAAQVFVNILKIPWIPQLKEVIGLNTDVEKGIQTLEALIKDNKKAIEMDESVPIILDGFNNVKSSIEKSLNGEDLEGIMEVAESFFDIDMNDLILAQLNFAFLLPFSIITSPYSSEPRYSEEIDYGSLKLINNFPEVIKNLKQSVHLIKNTMKL